MAKLTWTESTFSPGDYFADGSAGRWMVRKTKFRNRAAYFLKLDGALVDVVDSLEEAQAAAEQRTPDGEAEHGP